MKKNLVMFTSVFASLAILSTGFAAWVISGGDINAKTFGDITVDTIEDKRHNISSINCVDADENTKGKIIFGHPKNATTGWLTNTDANTVEKLVTVFKVTVNNAQSKAVADIFDKEKCTVTASAKDSTSANYTEALNQHYVGELPTVKFVSSETETSDATNLGRDGYIFVGLEFKWGSKFTKDGNVVNPYVYYNALSVTDYGNEANETLGKIRTLLTGAQFNLKIVTKA